MRALSARLFTTFSLLLIPLSQSGAQTNSPIRTLQQKLLYAIVQNQVEVVQTLLRQGGDPNARVKPSKEDAWVLKGASSDDPAPPLIVLACRYGCLESKVIDLLLAKGANVNITDKNGITPLMEASELDWDPSIALLLQHGANVKARDHNGKTALIYAMGNRGLGAAAKLLAKGADINVGDRAGKTPLMVAIMQAGQDPILLYGEDLVKKEKEAKERYLELIQFLIEQKADVNAKDTAGNTPLSLATLLGQKEIVQMLTKAGAKQ